MSVDINNTHFEGKYFEDIDKISDLDNYFIPVLKELIPEIDLPNTKILDVGCGTGLFLKFLIESGCMNCFGVDGFNEYAQRAIERGYKEVRPITDLCSTPIPYESSMFELVVCKDVLEHLIDPLYTLSEIKRVLKSGGFLLLHVPNHFPLIGRLKFLFTNEIDTFSFFKNESRWTFPHIRFYEYQDMISILNQYGFLLKKDLSYHFAAIPFFPHIRVFKGFRKYLIRRYPNQFACGFTFLVQKV